jgi:thiol-disulfide isomerase/thioredoxin
MSEPIVELKSEDFDEKFRIKPEAQSRLKLKRRVCILFFSPQCGHCVRFHPNYVAAAKKYKNASFATINCMLERGIMDRFRSANPKTLEYTVEGYPTVVSYLNGRYFSTYGQGNGEFRSIPDVIQYASGIGQKGIIRWV